MICAHSLYPLAIQIFPGPGKLWGKPVFFPFPPVKNSLLVSLWQVTATKERGPLGKAALFVATGPWRTDSIYEQRAFTAKRRVRQGQKHREGTILPKLQAVRSLLVTISGGIFVIHQALSLYERINSLTL